MVRSAPASSYPPRLLGRTGCGRDRIVPASRTAIGALASLAECCSQQARAQEHDAGRGQGKKSVGDNVVVAHDTPTTQMLVRIH